MRGKEKTKARASEMNSLFAATIDDPLPIDELLRKVTQEKESEDIKLEKGIRDYAKENPEQMIDLIRAWIIEDER